MNPLTSHLERIVGDRLKFDEPLKTHTHYAVGGPARFFVEAKTVEEIVELIAAVREHELDWVILGGGTNVLVNDQGFDGVVIKAANRSVQVDVGNARVTAEAGALSSMVARQTANAGLTGFEWAVSLPGTIGGAVRGNAGCFGGEIKDSLISAEVLNVESGEIEEMSNKDLKFGYRESVVKDNPLVVLRATFQLEERDEKETKEKIEYVLKCRLKTQPKNAKCAGCAFKNFDFTTNDDISKLLDIAPEVPQKFIDTNRIPAGWLIDQLGLKGTNVGGAAISEDHGNFITSDGSATADQLAQLIALIKTRVRDTYGIQLQEEVQYIGF